MSSIPRLNLKSMNLEITKGIAAENIKLLFVRIIAVIAPILIVILSKNQKYELSLDITKFLTIYNFVHIFIWYGSQINVVVDRNLYTLRYMPFLTIVVALLVLSQDSYGFNILILAILLSCTQFFEPIYRAVGDARSSNFLLMKPGFIFCSLTYLFCNDFFVLSVVFFGLIFAVINYKKFFKIKNKFNFKNSQRNEKKYFITLLNYLLANLDLLIIVTFFDYVAVEYFLVTRVVRLIEPIFMIMTHIFTLNMKDIDINVVRDRFKSLRVLNLLLSILWFLCLCLFFHFDFFNIFEKINTHIFSMVLFGFLLQHLNNGVGYYFLRMEALNIALLIPVLTITASALFFVIINQINFFAGLDYLYKITTIYFLFGIFKFLISSFFLGYKNECFSNFTR
jgi:hypothetical protein